MILGMTMFFFTGDGAKSKAFYEHVFGTAFMSQGPHWHQVPAGHATFALHGQRAGDPMQATDTLFFGFNVDDVAAVVARCRSAGGEVIRDVFDEAFGKVALIRDPEGRCLRFVQH
jgi:predicted enzyme related to lactoylglutathione lyase